MAKSFTEPNKMGKQAKEENWKILFYHDMEYAFISF